MELTAEEKQFKKMTETPVKPLILKLAAPTIVSMLVTSIYNMADTYFVAQLGKSASGAVGVVFSLMAIIQAVGFTLGAGAGSIVSRALGVREHEKANRIASSSFFTALAFGVVLTVVGSLMLSRLMTVLGATDTILPFAEDYATYILYGAPVMAGSFVLNNLLRAEGKARFSMIGLGIGGILNIGLDPIFIFVFDLGISGAAIATLISQVISFTLLLGFFALKKSVLRLSIKKMSRSFGDYAEIFKTGMPSFCRQGFASISTILLNNQAGSYGDAAVSAMSIVSKVFMLIFCVGLGIGQGYQPVVGYNYSAKRWSRVRSAFSFTFALGTFFMTCFGAATFIFAPQIVPLFIDNAEVIEIGTRALRFQACAMPLLTTNVICNMTFQSIGRKVKAVLLSCCRQGMFFIPCVLILPTLLGLKGVELTQAASDFLTCLVSIPFAVAFYREIRSTEKQNGAAA